MSVKPLLPNQRQAQTVTKRILFISPLPPPFYGSAMSSEQCLEFLKSDRRFEVKHIKLNYSREMSDLGRVNFYKLYGVVKVTRQIRMAIKQFRPELIYFMPATAGNAMLRDAFFLNIVKLSKKGRLILHLHSQFIKADWNHPLKRPIIKNMLDCDKLIVLGPELVGDLETFVAKEDIFVLANGISQQLSDQDFEAINQQRNSKGHLNLFFLSNMLEFKGWYKVLETCKLLKEAQVNFICHFGGGWPSDNEKQKFYDFVRINQLENLTIHHGRLQGAEKTRIFKQADIFIYPTEYDACPRVVIEAMEFGIPVISTRVGTIPTLVEHGSSGFIVENNTPEELFARVIDLQNKSIRIKMGTIARRRFLENYTADKYREKFASIIYQA